MHINNSNYIKKNKGPFFAVLSSLCYGLNNPLAGVALQNGIPTIVSVASRAFFMFVITLSLIVKGGTKPYVPKDIRYQVLILAISTCMINLCYVGSINYISVSLAAIIFFTFPIQILLVSLLIRKYPMRVSDIFIFLSVFVGLIFVIIPDFRNINMTGVLLASIASISATFLYFSASVATLRCSAVVIGFWVHLFVCPTLLIILYILNTVISFDNISLYIPVVLLSICYIGAYFFQMLSLKFTSVVISSLFFNTEPILTALAAAFILNERLLFSQYIGGILIFAALIIVSMRKE